MRVALIHNLNAGEGSHGTPHLIRLLRDAGHEVTAFGSRKGDVRRAAESRPDVHVVGGGDGTVAKTAKLLHECGVGAPLYVLPMGTSNNIARTLGATASIQELIRGLPDATPAHIDIGVVEAPWGRATFVEGAGFGFIGTMLERDGTVRDRLGRFTRRLLRPRSNQADRHSRELARLIRKQRAIACCIEADGEDLGGDFIGVEILNIREVGPRAALAPGADPADGMLDLVLIRERDREALAQFIVSRNSPGIVPGVCRRVRRVDLSWPTSSGHIDDEAWPDGKAMNRAGTVSVTVLGMVGVLRPLHRTPGL